MSNPYQFPKGGGGRRRGRRRAEPLGVCRGQHGTCGGERWGRGVFLLFFDILSLQIYGSHWALPSYCLLRMFTSKDGGGEEEKRSPDI